MTDIPPAQPTSPPSAPPSPPTPPAPQPPATPPPAPAKQPESTETDWEAEAKKWEGRAKENFDAASRLKEIEDGQRTEEERLQHELDEAKTTGSESAIGLLRLQVALDKAPPGLESAKVRKLAERLRGSTQEEMEADADELFADFAASSTTPSSNGATSQTPIEQLKPGTLPTGGEPSLADQIGAAEKAGDWTLARQLKSVQLNQLHQANTTPN